ncbi:MAG: hypothetical protein ACYDBH_01560 [Acidobacteriaceae bacterium]
MLYIANATKQVLRLHLRVPENTRTLVLIIESGTQAGIGKEWNIEQTESVITQLCRYGARNARDIEKPMEFSGILYHDRPITEDNIANSHDDVMEEAHNRSVAEITKAALSFDASQRDKQTNKRKARVTSLEVEQEVPPGERKRGNEVHFGLSVTPDGSEHVKLPI